MALLTSAIKEVFENVGRCRDSLNFKTWILTLRHFICIFTLFTIVFKKIKIN